MAGNCSTSQVSPGGSRKDTALLRPCAGTGRPYVLTGVGVAHLDRDNVPKVFGPEIGAVNRSAAVLQKRNKPAQDISPPLINPDIHVSRCRRNAGAEDREQSPHCPQGSSSVLCCPWEFSSTIFACIGIIIADMFLSRTPGPASRKHVTGLICPAVIRFPGRCPETTTRMKLYQTRDTGPVSL